MTSTDWSGVPSVRAKPRTLQLSPVRVTRAMQVTVAYEDLKGRPHTLQCEGPMAELMQHEIDHLDGILAVDRAVGLDPFAFRSEWEKYHLPAERYGVPYPREAPDEAIATRF